MSLDLCVQILLSDSVTLEYGLDVPLILVNGNNTGLYVYIYTIKL